MRQITMSRVGLALLILVALAAFQVALAQVGIGPSAAKPEAQPSVMAVQVLNPQASGTKYVAAGTSQGLRVYELTPVAGGKWQVKDVTQEEAKPVTAAR